MNLYKRLVVTLAAVICLAISVNAQSGSTGGTGGNCLVIKQKCKLQLKQTGRGFKLGGVDFKSGPVSKVGEISLTPQLLQQMTAIAQILDQMQLARCQLLNSTSSCDSSRQKIIVIQAVSNEQLGQLALLAQMYSSDPAKLNDALLKWIVQSADLIQKLTSSTFTAADATTAGNQAHANEALRYALNELKLTPGSPELRELLRTDQLRGQIGQ